MAIKDLTCVKKHLFLCNGNSCKQLGAEESIIAIRLAIKANGLQEEIHTTKTLCNGRCKDGPVIISQPDGIWFRQIFKEDAENFVLNFIIREFIPNDKFLYRYGDSCINTKEP